MNTEQQQYQPGQEIEWMMRPLANGSYLKGIVVKLGASKIGIAVQSPKQASGARSGCILCVFVR